MRQDAFSLLRRIGPGAADAHPALLRILNQEEDYDYWNDVIAAIETIKGPSSEYWLPDPTPRR